MSLEGKWGRRGRPPKSAYEEPIQEPEVIQKNYLGIDEALLRRIYMYQIKCAECGAPRWLKGQDRHQVKLCKPCTREFRLRRRREKAKKVYFEKRRENLPDDVPESLSDEDIQNS